MLNRNNRQADKIAPRRVLTCGMDPPDRSRQEQAIAAKQSFIGLRRGDTSNQLVDCEIYCGLYKIHIVIPEGVVTAAGL